MRNTSVFLLLILLLFLSCFFYTVESFVNHDSHESFIILKDAGPIDSVQIRYDHDRDNKDRAGDQNLSMINITELAIFDKNKKRIPYWNHQVYFEGGNWPNYPVNNLWDDNMNSMGHSAGPRSNLIVNFRTPQEIGSIQITNRLECCYERIQNYNLVLYKGGNAVGSRPLRQLGSVRKTVNYIVVYSPPKGVIGPKGDIGLQGPQGIKGLKGDKGDNGDPGAQGEKGYDGNRGAQGPKGDIGPQGPRGDIGPTGSKGPQGIEGPQGNIGPQGPQGISGIKGELGAIGLEGVVGASMRPTSN